MSTAFAAAAAAAATAAATVVLTEVDDDLGLRARQSYGGGENREARWRE